MVENNILLRKYSLGILAVNAIVGWSWFARFGWFRWLSSELRMSGCDTGHWLIWFSILPNRFTVFYWFDFLHISRNVVLLIRATKFDFVRSECVC